jgi:hypothetical protein
MRRVPWRHCACPAKRASGLGRTRFHHLPDIAHVHLMMAVRCPRNTESDLLGVRSASGPDASIFSRPNEIDQCPVEPEPSICATCTAVLNATRAQFQAEIRHYRPHRSAQWILQGCVSMHHTQAMTLVRRTHICQQIDWPWVQE